MSEWQGFSDRELTVLRHGVPAGGRRPLEGGKGPSRGGSRVNAPGIGVSRNGGHTHRPPTAQTRKQVMIRGGEGRRHASTSSASPSGDLSRTAFFHPPTPNGPPEVAREPVKRSQPPTSQTGREARQTITADGPHASQTSHHTEAPETKSSIQSGPAEGLIVQDSTESSQTDVTLTDSPRLSLEELQRQQRDIEAENKKRKALIEQALQERYKKTQVEANTLSEVKKELDKLDLQVSRDISILRDKIEEASRQYMVARKRYELAETEFVAAKMELHRSSELKELMSEHLCTVIQQNELRKAKKLGELLRALNVEPPDGSNILPVLFQKTPTPGMDIWPGASDHMTHTSAHCARKEAAIQEAVSPRVETGKGAGVGASEEVEPSDKPGTLSKDREQAGDPQITPPTGSTEPQMTSPTGNAEPQLTPPTGNVAPQITSSTGNAAPLMTPPTGNVEPGSGWLSDPAHIETAELSKPTVATGGPDVVAEQQAAGGLATVRPPTGDDGVLHTRLPHEHLTFGSSAGGADCKAAASSSCSSASKGESCPSSEEGSSLSDSGHQAQLQSGVAHQNHE